MTRPASADAASVAVLKSDLLALQNRIDILNMEKPKTAISHPMQQQEKWLLSIAALDGDDMVETKAKLLESVLTKIRELSALLGRMGTKSGLVSPHNQSDALLNLSDEVAALPPVTPDLSPCAASRPMSATDYNVKSAVGAVSPAPPTPLLLPFGGNRNTGRSSYVDVFVALIDALTAACVEDYDPQNLSKTLSIEEEKRRIIEQVRTEYLEATEKLKSEHAAYISQLQSDHKEDMERLQSKLDEHQQHLTLAMTRKGGAPEKMSKDTAKEMKELHDENARLLESLEALEKVHQQHKAELEEAKAVAFGGVLDQQSLVSLGFDVKVPEVQSPREEAPPPSMLEVTTKPRAPSRAGLGDRRPSATMAAMTTRAVDKKGKVAEKDEGESKTARLQGKLDAYHAVLQEQNRILQQVQKQLPDMLNKRASEDKRLRDEATRLRQLLDAAVDDREHSKAETQKKLRDKQAEVICLRKELEQYQTERTSQLLEIETEQRTHKALPLVMHVDHPAPLGLMQKLKGQGQTLSKLDKQLAQAQSDAAASEEQVALLQKEVKSVKEQKEGMETALWEAKQKCEKLAYELDNTRTELEETKSKLQWVSDRFAQQSAASSAVYQRAKRLELELQKANRTFESLQEEKSQMEVSQCESLSRREQEMQEMMTGRDTVERRAEEDMQKKEQELLVANERVVSLRQQLKEAKEAVTQTVMQAADLFEHGNLLMSIQFSILNPTPSQEKPLDLKRQLVEVGKSLAALEPSVDSSWLAHIRTLEHEQQWLTNIFEENQLQHSSA
eukprot:CAMPEP_0174312090 /NCGR_PEP_ID=MMETSP0810-20121108/4082_1 /TAXON_ID=73025 ORGANISM="Eutreptiella gymnastica-like, Strain CCMP1594" /NCGR_SAMPLE_ID=MMETSP0810 /ASSEMBLY_ACC=CAM_ASM_000659 /LENGTH=785 /DNA_ID=CAMNT_0015420415 /DNA_START=172 /DNA_END=2529 /DNA_ORIENTATION=+